MVAWTQMINCEGSGVEFTDPNSSLRGFNEQSGLIDNS